MPSSDSRSRMARVAAAIIVFAAMFLGIVPVAHAAADTTAPTAPGVPVYSQVTPFSVTITWTPSTDDVGVTWYSVRRTLLNGGTWNDSIQAPANTITIRDLTPNQNYTWVVIASDAAGNGATSPAASVRTLNYTAGPMCSITHQAMPSSPGSFFSTVAMTNLSTGPWQEWTLSFTLASNQQVRPEWGFLQNGNRWSASFVWLWTSGAGPLMPNGTRSVSFSGTYTGTSNPAPTQYTINDHPCTVTGVATPPGPVGNLTPAVVTSGSVSLTWTAATPGTNPIRGYEVFVNGVRYTCVGVNPLGCLVSGLTPNTSYVFSVRAVDTTGLAGPLVAIVVQTHAGSPPSAPTNLRVSGVTTTGATLTWNASTPGTSPISGYVVFRVDGTTETAIAVSPTPVATTVTLANLTPNTQYTMRVRARDANSVLSGPSNTVVFTTLAPPSTCTVTYSVNDWGNGSGFTGSVTITNNGTVAVNGWTLAFTWPASQRVVQGWNATWVQPTGSPNVTATNLGWNATIAASASVNIGFNGSFSGSNPRPTGFTLNGAPCAIA